MTTYIVKKPLEHDGKNYKPGDSIDLADVNADYLLRKGVIGKKTTTTLTGPKADDPSKEKQP